jgi:predicted nuclease of predicted toxin-antitoxin system
VESTTNDVGQLAFAAANGRTLVTSDRDFIILSATPKRMSGALAYFDLVYISS